MSKTNKRIWTKKFLNTLLVIIVITLFISTAIIAIIYTQGGKITRSGIVETGSIRLEIQPEDRENLIFLDNKPVKSDERLINNVTPGLHTIRIESDKFHSWEKEILISPSYVTNIQVKLFPLEPELSQLTQTNISKLFFSEDGSYAYYLVDDPLVEPNQRGLWRLRLEEQELFFRRNSDPERILTIDDTTLSYFTDPGIEVKIDYNNNKMLIINPNIQTVTIFDPTKSSTAEKLINLNEQIGFYPSKIYWFNNNNSLIASNDEIIIEYNTVNQEKTIVAYIPDTQPIYDTNGDVLYTYSPDNKNISLYQNQVARILQFPANFPLDSIGDLRLARDGSSIIIKNESNYYYYQIEKKQFIEINNSGAIMDISFDGTSIIFNNNGQVVYSVIDKSLIDDTLMVQTTQSLINMDLKPKFINNSNLIIINNYPLRKMQISENDGTNLVDILNNTTIDNGYFKFQEDGSSLTLMIEDTSEENILSKNLFKLVLNTSSLPFNL